MKSAAERSTTEPTSSLLPRLPEPVGAVHEGGRVTPRIHQRMLGAAGNRNVGAGQLDQGQGIRGAVFESHVAEDRRDAHHLDRRGLQREEDRHRIVDPRVGIDDHLGRFRGLGRDTRREAHPKHQRSHNEMKSLQTSHVRSSVLEPGRFYSQP